METRGVVHPSVEALRALALGKLDDSTASVVLSHLDICPECRREVAAATNDDFLNRLRNVHQRGNTLAPAESLAEAPRRPQPPTGPTTLYNVPPELADHPEYDVLRELGRGGMGVVYQARHKLSGRVEVLKVMSKELLGRPESRERFLREIQSAARLDHRNVVKMYTAQERGGLMVLVMEYVEGEDLAQVVKARGPLSVLNACYYTQQAALGLQHAFEKGMVHRDIKPQNLMLAREGKKHIVKILDFGLAKATQGEGVDAGLTGTGAMMGTPGYVAPEQSLDAAAADIRADIYSLGCTLYHLLSGNPPFSGKSVFEIMQAHHLKEAVPLNQVRPEIPQEVALVVRKMMAKEAAQRYQTPAEVVMALGIAGKQAAKGSPKSSPDVAAPTTKARTEEEKRLLRAETNALPAGAAQAMMLGGEAASAGAWDSLTPSNSTLAEARSARGGRNRRAPAAWKKWLIGGGIGVFLCVLLGMWANGVFKVKTANGTIVLENLPADAKVLVDGATVTLEAGDGKTVTIDIRAGKKHQLRVKKEGFKVFGQEVEIDAGDRRAIRVRLQPESTTVEKSQPLDPQPPIKPKAEDVPPPTKPKSEDPTPPPPTKPVPAAVGAGEYDLTGGYRFVHFGKDGTRVVLWAYYDWSKHKQSFARVYDLATGQALTPPLKHDLVRHASFSPDGKQVVTASWDHTARLWDAATGTEVTPPLQHEDTVWHVSFSPDGQRVVTASEDKTARLWDAATGKEVTPPLQHEGCVVHASFSPDGQRVVTASLDKTARLWDAATGKEVTPPLKHEDSVRHASFSPDGQRVATASWDHTARLWDAATGKVITPPLKHENTVWHASFSPDGQRVVTASEDKTARLWDAGTGKEVTPPLQHEGSVWRASFSPDGRRVVTASYDNTAQLWDAGTGKEVTPPLRHEERVYHASFSPDGQRVGTISLDQKAWLWAAATGMELKKVTITPK